MTDQNQNFERLGAEPKIWDFLDYRHYLKSYYEFRKRNSKGRFSYRLFSIKTGVDSPNYLKLIVDGARNLTPPHARRVAKYCALTESEKKYFLSLVRWNQNAEKEDADALWMEVLRTRSINENKSLSNAQLSILTQWYTVAIFELLQLKKEPVTIEEIASRLRWNVSIKEIEHSLECLLKTKVIKKSTRGYRVVQSVLTTTDDIPSASVRQYHKQVIRKSIEAIDEVELSEREFVSITFSLSKSDMPKFKERIRELRNLIVSESEANQNREEIYQLNVQLFPLTLTSKEPK